MKLLIYSYDSVIIYFSKNSVKFFLKDYLPTFFASIKIELGDNVSEPADYNFFGKIPEEDNPFGNSRTHCVRSIFGSRGYYQMGQTGICSCMSRERLWKSGCIGFILKRSKDRNLCEITRHFNDLPSLRENNFPKRKWQWSSLNYLNPKPPLRAARRPSFFCYYFVYLIRLIKLFTLQVD